MAKRNRKLNTNMDESKETQDEIKAAWAEFTKDSEKARQEINEAFTSEEEEEWTLANLGIIIVATLLVAGGITALVRFLLQLLERDAKK